MGYPHFRKKYPCTNTYFTHTVYIYIYVYIYICFVVISIKWLLYNYRYIYIYTVHIYIHIYTYIYNIIYVYIYIFDMIFPLKFLNVITYLPIYHNWLEFRELHFQSKSHIFLILTYFEHIHEMLINSTLNSSKIDRLTFFFFEALSRHRLFFFWRDRSRILLSSHCRSRSLVQGAICSKNQMIDGTNMYKPWVLTFPSIPQTSLNQTRASPCLVFFDVVRFWQGLRTCLSPMWWRSLRIRQIRWQNRRSSTRWWTMVDENSKSNGWLVVWNIVYFPIYWE